MTARRVFRLALIVVALVLTARHFGYFGSTVEAPAQGERRDPVVFEVPPDVIGRGARPPDTPAAPVAPQRDLQRDEARGGHTLARHVARSDDELRARLSRERRISAASAYTDRPTAERVVALTLERQHDRVARWAAREGQRPNLALDYEGEPGTLIGRSIARGEDTAAPCHDAVVVLRWETSAGDWYVLTSYPEARRGRR